MSLLRTLGVRLNSEERASDVVTVDAGIRPDGPIFEIRNISFAYPVRKGPDLHVLDRVSMSLQRKQTVSILGPSGCGKSTLLAIAAGLQKPSDGDVLVEGDVSTSNPGRTGFMMQRDELFTWRSVLENVLIGPEIVHGKVRVEDRRLAFEYLRVAGLDGFEHHYPSALSGGMRQRVAFVRTLMLGRPLLLLDEPFGALDAITRSEMQEWLTHMQADLGLSLLFVTHDIDEAIFLSDHVFVLAGRPGRFVLEREVPFVRPRNYEECIRAVEFGELKSELLHAIRASTAGIVR